MSSASHDVRALDALRRLVRAIDNSSRQLDRDAGVTSAQRYVLEHLGDVPALSVNELAGRTRTTQATVSVVVGRLVARGLVARTADPADRRRRLVALTPAGRKLVNTSAIPAQLRLARALDRMSRREVAALARSLETWIARAGLARVPAAMMLEPVRRRHDR